MAQSSIYGILKNNIPYRNLWVGRTGRSLGAWIYRITLLTYVVRTLPHGTGIAWILLASGLPAVIISPWAGPIIDGIDQRQLLIGGNFILAAVTLGLFALARYIPRVLHCRVTQRRQRFSRHCRHHLHHANCFP